MYNWIPRHRSNNFLNIYYFSNTCITENTQIEHAYNEKALYFPQAPGSMATVTLWFLKIKGKWEEWNGMEYRILA